MNNLYLYKDCNHHKLIEHGFKQSGNNYRYTLPVYTKDNECFVEAEFLVSLQENYIGYDIVDTCNNTLYHPFYDDSYSQNNLVVEMIEKNLSHELQRMYENHIIQKKGVIKI